MAGDFGRRILVQRGDFWTSKDSTGGGAESSSITFVWDLITFWQSCHSPQQPFYRWQPTNWGVLPLKHLGSVAQQAGNPRLTVSFVFHFSSLIGVLPLGQYLLILRLYLTDTCLPLFCGIPLQGALMGDAGCIAESLAFVPLQKKLDSFEVCRCLSSKSPCPLFLVNLISVKGCFYSWMKLFLQSLLQVTWRDCALFLRPLRAPVASAD